MYKLMYKLTSLIQTNPLVALAVVIAIRRYLEQMETEKLQIAEHGLINREAFLNALAQLRCTLEELDK